MNTFWYDATKKLPPACQEVIVTRFKYSSFLHRTMRITEVYFVSTHPKECVEEDRILYWMQIPPLPE